MKKLDAKVARKLNRSFREPKDLSGTLRLVEMIAKSGIQNCSVAFPRTRMGASRAISVRDSLIGLGFSAIIDSESFKDLLLEIDWNEKKE